MPSYEDDSLPAVREYKSLLEKHDPMPRSTLVEAGYKPLKHHGS